MSDDNYKKTPKRSKSVRIGDREMNSSKTHHLPKELLTSLRTKFPNNYFGLPPYSLQQSSHALTYKSRAPLQEDLLKDEDNEIQGHSFGRGQADGSDSLEEKVGESASMTRPGHGADGSQKAEESNYTAQRKVASALLTMVSNGQMIGHFLYKGGLTAVLKITHESKDLETLLTCAQSLIQASNAPEYCRYLVEQNVFSALQLLAEVSNDALRHRVAVIIANLSTAPDLEELLMLHNILSLIQGLNNHVHRTDSMCMLLVALSNTAPAITQPEHAEQVMRIVSQNTQKIDVIRYVSKAAFIANMYNNYSRLSHYSSLLVEEGVLPLLLHLIDTHPVDEVLRPCAEALGNLSMNRKNRREISSSGLASRLTLLFDRGSSATRSSVLLVLGNLLSSNLFHDKVAHHETISTILDKQLDLALPKQFNAVAYCLCQLSKVDSSCAVMVDCGVVPMMLRYLRKAPQESLDYLWSVLTNITSFPQFFPQLMQPATVKALLNELYEEVRFDSSSLHQQMSVVQIGLHLSRRPDFSSYLSQELIDRFVQTMKVLFSSRLGTSAIQMSALTALISFNQHCREARATTLGGDLIELFQEVGIEDDKMNVRYVGLLNIISNEEPCCYKLLERGAQKVLVSLQDSFVRLSTGYGGQNKKAKKKAYRKGESIRNMNSLMEAMRSQQQHSHGDGNDSDGTNDTASLGGGTGKQRQKGGGHVHHGYLMPTDGSQYEFDAALEGELGKELTAATLHNLSLKRPVGAPGVLMTLLSLARNCKTLRVLHCIRSLANMSAHPKAKVMLSKEAPRILPMLTVTMRCGCMEAEKVQHYCAITMCNLLAAPLDKALMAELIKTGAIVDLVVVTLLRINSLHTKETLAKAFFNLLNRAEIRETLIMKLDMLAAMLELAKHEYIELLELCMKALFNITCELRPGSGFEGAFATKLSQLKVPQMVVARLVFTPSMEGSVGTRGIRYLLGKIVANLSFNPQLVVELANSHGTNSQGTTKPGSIADALYRVYVLHMDETTFCACATLFNLSRIPECRVLADSGRALQLAVEVLSKEVPVDCTRLLAAALCNFSTMSVFHESMGGSTEVMQCLISILASPQVHHAIKMDVVQTVYNLVTAYPAARERFVHNEGVGALWRVLKVQGAGGGKGSSKAGGKGERGSEGGEGEGEGEGALEDEGALVLIAHIVKELCETLYDIKYEKRLLTDGVMHIVLKLSKVELGALKLDMSFCIYSLCRAHDLMRVLKSDSADVLFWLTLHDTLSLQDVLDKNVSRALRCFSATVEESKVLVRAERFLPTLKALAKSKNEDVLWQTAGVLYSMMQVDYCLKILLERGLVQLIFDIAASGYESVRHVCSACLHMIPDNMPNMEDPVVLELVLCLLEAQGDKFSELSEKPSDLLAYGHYVDTCFAGSSLEHPGTGFKASWLPQSCEVDSVFSPALIPTPIDDQLHITLPALDATAFSNAEAHAKIARAEYKDFKKDTRDARDRVRDQDPLLGGSVSTAGTSIASESGLEAASPGMGGMGGAHRTSSYPTALLEGNPAAHGNIEADAEAARRYALDSNLSINIATPALPPKQPPHSSSSSTGQQGQSEEALRAKQSLRQQSVSLDAQMAGRGSGQHGAQAHGQDGSRSRSGSPQHYADDFEDEDFGGIKGQQQQQVLRDQQEHMGGRTGGSVNLPLIGSGPSIPEDTVGALSRSIRREHKHQHGPGSSRQMLSLSASLEPPASLLPPDPPGSRGNSRGNSRGAIANLGRAASGGGEGSGGAGGGGGRRSRPKKVIQVSNNTHGNLLG